MRRLEVAAERLDVLDFDAFHSHWCDVAWLAPLWPIPESAVLPRFMSERHPAAVGSYGGQAIADIEERRANDPGIPAREKGLRWGQKLILLRRLEHDVAGSLVWDEVAITLPRQQGKSVVLSEFAWWRCERMPDVLGRPQTVLHFARTTDLARKVQGPVRRWASRLEAAAKEVARLESESGALPRDYVPLYVVRGRTGEEEIEWPDMSLWMIRSAAAAVGLSADDVEADECWDLVASTIDDDVSPTMSARLDPQIGLYSTAHPRARSLFLERRHAALALLAGGEDDDGHGDEPESSLYLEWSADRDADPDDEGTWRSAQMHWDAPRRRWLLREHRRWRRKKEDATVAMAGGFPVQYLNQWPIPRVERDVVRVPDRAMPGWDDLGDAGPDPGRGGIVAVDESRDGSVIGVLRLVDGRRVFYGEVGSVAEAAEVADTGEHVIVGLSLAKPLANEGLRTEVVRMGMRELAVHTRTLEQAVLRGRLSHDRDPRMAVMAAGAVIRETEAGRSVSAKASEADILGPKLLAWALGLARQVDDAPERPAIF